MGARLIQEGRADTAAYRDFLLNYSSALQATGLPQLFWLWVLAKNEFFIYSRLYKTLFYYYEILMNPFQE